MTIPYSFIEAQQARGEELRDKSLAAHEVLMHLPQQESQLKRIFRRLQSMTSRLIEAAPQPEVPEELDTDYPPAFSK
jgi:hypothetical protein